MICLKLRSMPVVSLAGPSSKLVGSGKVKMQMCSKDIACYGFGMAVAESLKSDGDSMGGAVK